MKPLRVALINMPFGAPWLPSLGLSQLRAAVLQRLGDDCELRIHYLNLDFADWLGRMEAYNLVLGPEGTLAGLGDWLFSHIAFPEAPDNTTAYIKDLLEPIQTREVRSGLEFIIHRRPEIENWIEQSIRSLRLEAVDVLGFTSLFAQQTASLALARMAKRIHPSLTTLMGGASCEGEMGTALAEIAPFMDFIFTGPALRSFPVLLERLAKHPRTPVEAIRIPGVVSSKSSSLAPDVPENIDPLPEAPIPKAADYEDFLDRYDQVFANKKSKPFLLFQTSRGCWWAERQPCSFCGLNGCRRRFQALPPEDARRKIAGFSRWRDRCASLLAVDNVMPRNYPREVFSTLDAPPGIPIQYEVRVGMSRQELQWLHAAGVSLLQPGIEALSSATLRRMGKGTSAFENLIFLKYCLEIGIRVRWNLLIGFPGESRGTYAHYRRLLPRLMHLPPPDGVFPVDFSRFSPYFEQAESYGLALKPRRAYEYIYPFGESLRQRLAVHFVDRNSDPEDLQSWLDRLNGDVANWRRRWFNRDNRTRARLSIQTLPDGGAEVFDSRFGDPLRYRIGPRAQRLLDHMGSPWPPEAPDAGGEPLPGRTPETALVAELEARGLLFYEDGRRLSLVPAENKQPLEF